MDANPATNSTRTPQDATSVDFDPASDPDEFRNDSGNGELTHEQVLERLALTVREAIANGSFEGTLFETQVSGLLWLLYGERSPANTRLGHDPTRCKCGCATQTTTAEGQPPAQSPASRPGWKKLTEHTWIEDLSSSAPSSLSASSSAGAGEGNDPGGQGAESSPAMSPNRAEAAPASHDAAPDLGSVPTSAGPEAEPRTGAA